MMNAARLATELVRSCRAFGSTAAIWRRSQTGAGDPGWRGMQDTRILVSGDLNEYRIEEMLAAGARSILFGVGTELSTRGTRRR